MYHRFEENKYPSTNIKINDFNEHLEIIKRNEISFVHPSNFEQELKDNKMQRKVLLTIDDGFLSFYENAWPILKKNKIPFILFVSTREVGAFNYMTWDQIRELSKEDFVEIGNHSHTHEYLIDESNDVIKNDIKQSISIFGQWTWSGQGIAPLDRESNKNHKILKFPILRASVKAYQNNLNTHKSYSKFREKRRTLREKNKKIAGLQLTETLNNYAQTGSEYTKILNQIIKQNRLTDFEPVKLVNSVKKIELSS